MLLQVGPILARAILSSPAGPFLAAAQIQDLISRRLGGPKFTTLGTFFLSKIAKLGVRTTERLPKAIRAEIRSATRRGQITGDPVVRIEDPFRQAGFALATEGQIRAGLTDQLLLDAAIRRAEPEILTRLGFKPDTAAARARMLSGGRFPNITPQAAEQQLRVARMQDLARQGSRVTAETEALRQVALRLGVRQCHSIAPCSKVSADS